MTQCGLILVVAPYRSSRYRYGRFTRPTEMVLCKLWWRREDRIAMPRRARPPNTSRSEHWLRMAANDASNFVNEKISSAFGWRKRDTIEWLSPVESDQYAEYYDGEFLKRLGIGELKISLHSFWPRSGPRWDGLARTSSGKFLLVEAKAYIEEAVDFGSKGGQILATEHR